MPHHKNQTLNINSSTLVSEIVKYLYPYNYSVSGEGLGEAISAFKKLLPFQVEEFPSESSLRGWFIPKGWRVIKAQLSIDGKIIHDCIEKTPLGCAYLSPSFKGKVSKAELIEHCTYREDLPEATVYDWTRLYRKGIDSWGLSIPWRILQSIPNNDIDIDIKTEEYDSSMKTIEYLIPGISNEEIIINAHNCHPYQANDDISGCAVAIKIFSEIFTKIKPYYSYRLLIAPELFGPMFWLEKNGDHFRNIKGCILLKSVGNDFPLKLQKSFEGNTSLDKIAELAIKDITTSSNFSYPFRTYYGNDETVFEAPGFEIPTITLTRYPFTERHTDLDNLELINNESLEETYKVLKKIINIIESNKKATSVAEGLFCLSNPIYNLYRMSKEPGISKVGTSEKEKSWNLMMNCLPRLLHKGFSLVEISREFNLPYSQVYDYILDWEEKKLVFLEHSKL